MRSRLSAVTIAAAAALLAAPAAGQHNDPNTRTETQERLAQSGNSDLPWDLIGLFGLLGLLGFRRDHPDDGYHPAAVE